MMQTDEFLRFMYEITQKIPEELNNNRDLVVNIVRQNGMALKYASDELRDDYEIVKTAVYQNGMALQFASNRLQNTQSIVTYAVLENGLSLQYASETLRDNHEIVISALWTDNTAIEYASDAIKKMRDPVSLINEGKDPDKYLEKQLPKSSRFHYAVIKTLYTEAQAIRSELHVSSKSHKGGLVEPANPQDDTLRRLDAFINAVYKTSKSSSTYLDTDEILSDLEWIKEYYEKREWTNLTRWLSNIDSSLREMWSDYIKKIVDKKTR